MLNRILKNPLGIFTILGLLFLTACGEKTVISVPTESEALEIIVILHENGIISADKKLGGTEQKKEFEIFVSDGVFGNGSYNEAMRLLRNYCLPYEKPDEIQTKGLVDASEILKAKTQRQRKVEIIQQLRKTIPGITCIDLTFNSPQSALERLNAAPATASVSLQYNTSPPSFTNEQIRDLVSKSVPDLKVENVQVYSYFVPIEKAELQTQSSQNKIIILIASAVGLIFLVMAVIVILRKRKTESTDDENDDLNDDSEVPLLEAGDEDEEEE
ncbi:MAG: hypothetical protein MUC29_05055 [Pyrinomonadaceae bacterium]|jgi:type III secretion protein J|nr:hypothetical protein [Pyrinomonadaceae bacterium]